MNSLDKFGLAAGLGGLGAGFGSLMMEDNNNPYDDASKYFNQIPGTISPYFNPYINAGHDALSRLQGEYGNLLNDPTGLMNRIGAGYQKSPGYDFQMREGLNAANNAAASGGMSGTPLNQYNASKFATGLANQDYYNYVNHGLEQYGLGLQGLGNINNTGYNASNELAGGLANSLINQGNLAFAGSAAQNQSRGTQWGDILGGLGTLAAFL